MITVEERKTAADRFIPVNTPVLEGNELKYLAECINTGWISSEGPMVRRFEEDVARRCGRRHGIAVCNGTAALQVAVDALGLAPGDEVIMPTFTIISCAAAVIRAGGVPVLIDSDPITWNIRVDHIESRITSRTRAIMPVHIYGLPVDMDPVLCIAEKHGLAVIEDAAEAIGLRYKNRPCGGMGTLSTFSFYPNKHATTGEGGMVTTDDATLAERCRELRNLCFQPGRRFVHESLGWNFRMTNLQAAVGVAQLEQLDEFMLRKRRMGLRYAGMLADVPGLQLPPANTQYADNCYWVFGLVLDESVPFDAGEAMSRLKTAGIGTRPFFFPMHEQPVFRAMGLFDAESYPVAERIARRGFYIPSGLGLSDDEMETVVHAVRGIMQ